MTSQKGWEVVEPLPRILGGNVKRGQLVLLTPKSWPWWRVGRQGAGYPASWSLSGAPSLTSVPLTVVAEA